MWVRLCCWRQHHTKRQLTNSVPKRRVPYVIRTLYRGLAPAGAALVGRDVVWPSQRHDELRRVIELNIGTPMRVIRGSE